MTTATEQEMEVTNPAGSVSDVADRPLTMYENFWNENPLGVLEINTEDIHISPEDNGRVITPSAGDKSLKSFADGIAQNGQETPVKVRLVNGLPHLVYGFRRLAALQMNNAGAKPGEQVPVIAMLHTNASGDDDNLDALSTNARENIQRQDLTPMDILKIIAKMSAKTEDGGFGLADKEIADRIGVSRSMVNIYRNNLMPLSDASKKLIATGKVSASAAIELMSSKALTVEQVDAELLKLAEAVAEGGGGVKGAKAGSARNVKAAARKKAEASGKGTTKQRTSREIIADLTEDVPGDSKPVKTIKAALLKYAQGKLKFDTLIKQIAELV